MTDHKRNPNIECYVCGNSIYRRPSVIKKCERIYCSNKCKGIDYKNRGHILKNLNEGHGWNKGLSKENGDVLLYGRPRSEKTKRNISEALKKVLVKKGEIVTCLICGHKFYVYPSQLKRGNGKFCSKRCATISGNLRQKMSDTDIERILERWLKNEQVEYDKQKPIEGITIVDFFVEPNNCIYADGDYWHTLEVVKMRDEKIDSQLESKGYNVIRLWGSEIKAGVRPIEILC